MDTETKNYECGSSIVFAALYDVLDLLFWKMISSHSEEGFILVLPRKSADRLLVRVKENEDGSTAVAVEFSAPAPNAALLQEAQNMTGLLDEILDKALQFPQRSG